MNLKTSLKTVVSTLFELKLPVLGLLMLLFCITACNQHEVLSPTDSSTEPSESLEALNLSDEEAAFFSDNNVEEIIQFRTFDELNRSGQERLLFHDAILQTKQFMRRMNLQMEDKYISHIVQNIGQPVWLASYVIDLENGCSLTFIPIVEDGSEKVAGVISYYKGENDDRAYSLTTRHQIATATQDDYDPNYNFLIQMFYEFDKQLFDYQGEEYNEWAGRRWWYPIYHDSDCVETLNCLTTLRTLPTNRIVHGFGGTAFDTSPFTGAGSLSGLCFVYCSPGCSDGVYNAGIVDTAEEATWLSGSCGYANILDNFLEDNDVSDVAVTEAGQVLMDIGIAGVLNFSELKDLANALDAFFDNPDSEANAEDLYVALHGLNIDILSLNVFNLTANTLPDFNIPFFGNWEDMNAGLFFAFTKPLKDTLKAHYPSQTLRIDSFFTCRVLGFAQEDAVVTSLGVQNNPIPPADPIINYNKRPDGFTQNPVWDDDALYLQPFFIESKGKYGGWESAEYNYSSQMAQFNGYRRYLSSPLKTHEPYCSVAHGLYMILPANVSLADTIKNACSNDNIPLYYSGIEYDADYTNLSNIDARVKYPILQNINDLDYSCHVFDFVGDVAMKWALERVKYDWRDYDAVDIAAFFQQRTDAFEQSYLVGNDNGCGED